MAARFTIEKYDGVINPHTWFREFENLSGPNKFSKRMLTHLLFLVEPDVKAFLSSQKFLDYASAKKGVCDEYWGKGRLEDSWKLSILRKTTRKRGRMCGFSTDVFYLNSPLSLCCAR